MKIKNIKIRLQLENGTQELTFKGMEQKDNKVYYNFEKKDEPTMEASIIIEKHDGISVFYAKVLLSQTPFRENNNLETQSPVIISIEPEILPTKICAQYQHRDWWSRPAFGNSYSNVPERTQSLFVKYEESFGCFIPMVGDKTKSYIQGGLDNTLEIRMTSYTSGLHRIDDICLLFIEGTEFYQIAEEIWEKACYLKKIPNISKRRYPEMFEYFGWCSWDAFYTDITEEKVREKALELKEKKIPVRWLLMDDGWLSIKDQKLYDFQPEKSKFPCGFTEMIVDIKSDSMIDHVGVWHAFGGYWGGILSGSKLAVQCEENLYKTKNEKLIPHYETEKGFGFWRKWYLELREQGIDFVKVDGQSALKNYYRNNEEIAKVAKGSHQSLEAATELFMDGNLINCMGMALENVFNRPTSGISRNSDDFVPEDENGFREHMLQNAYNSLYHSKVYHCDWDMYWTKHKDASKHALVRAISGGPIYVSDRVGETVLEEIKPLVYNDGRILRMDCCALPTIDSIFDSPLDGNNLTLTNTINGTGATAIFHIGEKDELNSTNIKPSDIYGLDGENFLVYHFFSNKIKIVEKEEKITVNLQKDEYDLLLFIPKKKGITPIGLIDKYMSCHSIKGFINNDGTVFITLRDGGKFAFHADINISHIEVNGTDMSGQLQQTQGFYQIDLSALQGEIIVRISE